MSFFISDAWAQGAGAPPQEASAVSFIFLILLFVVFYFFLMRPQIKRAKEHKKMVESLSKNDEVVTSGGLLGRVTKIDEAFITVEVADGVRLRFQKNAVASLLPKGTLKQGKETEESKEASSA